MQSTKKPTVNATLRFHIRTNDDGTYSVGGEYSDGKTEETKFDSYSEAVIDLMAGGFVMAITLGSRVATEDQVADAFKQILDQAVNDGTFAHHGTEH